MRNVNSDSASTGVCAKASLTKMALVENSIAPDSVMRKPASVSFCFTSGMEQTKAPHCGAIYIKQLH